MEAGECCQHCTWLWGKLAYPVQFWLLMPKTNETSMEGQLGHLGSCKLWSSSPERHLVLSGPLWVRAAVQGWAPQIWRQGLLTVYDCYHLAVCITLGFPVPDEVL